MKKHNSVMINEQEAQQQLSKKATKQPRKVSGFNFQKFKALPNVYRMFDYAVATLGVSKACGAGRCMWKFTINGKMFALKVARNDDEYAVGGIGQNRDEIEAADCVKGSPYFTQVIKYDPKYRWIIAELAETPLDLDNFKKYTGGISFFEVYGSRNDLRFLFDIHYPHNHWLEDFINTIERCDLNPSDWHRQNWGQVGNRPVVLDYGNPHKDMDV